MAYAALPSIDILNKRLRYDPETGHLYWKPLTPADFEGKGRKPPEELCKNFNTAHAGRRAGSQNHKHGYWCIGIQRKVYYLHRIAWKMATGFDPDGEIDHINGDPEDNRLCNLRVVSGKENNRSKEKRRHSSSWRRGVVWTGDAWVATAGTPGKPTFRRLGQYQTRDDAIRARQAFERDRRETRLTERGKAALLHTSGTVLT